MADRSGLLLAGRYRLTERLGQGGSAAVYRGNDIRLDRPVAVKMFHEHGTGPTMVARQQTEMLFLAQLNHPNLVSIYDAHVPPSEADHCTAVIEPSFLVMEFVDGVNLAQRLACRTMTLDETAGVGQAVANALAVVHGHSLIHRDVKPANILMPATGGAKLTDFGIARMLDSAHLTMTAEVVGTPLYLSPEQARGSEVGSATDIYSLGLVLLECLTGNSEFPGTPVQSAIARLLRDPHVPIGLPPPWHDLLRSMTSPVAAKRPTAETVASVLAAHLDDRERSRTAATVSTPALADEMGAYASSPPALARAPARLSKHAARPRLWGLAVLIGGLTLAVTGVSIALTGPPNGQYPTGPASIPSVLPSNVHTAPTAARIAATTSASLVETAQRDADLAVKADVIALITETVTTVSTVIQTSTSLSETPSPTTTVSDIVTPTPTPTPDSTTSIGSPVTMPSAPTLPSDSRSTDTQVTETQSHVIGTTFPPDTIIGGTVANVPRILRDEITVHTVALIC